MVCARLVEMHGLSFLDGVNIPLQYLVHSGSETSMPVFAPADQGSVPPRKQSLETHI